MTSPIVSDDAAATLSEEKHLPVPVIRGEGLSGCLD